MPFWDEWARQQCQQQVDAGEGVNYNQARATYGNVFADAIFHELGKRGKRLAFVSEREHERLVEWKDTGDKRANGIIKNIVAYTCDEPVDEPSRDEQLRQECWLRVEAEEGVNYVQARSTYGNVFADAIFHELGKRGKTLAFVSEREHERLIEWKDTGDKRANGIIKNIIQFTITDD